MTPVQKSFAINKTEREIILVHRLTRVSDNEDDISCKALPL